MSSGTYAAPVLRIARIAMRANGEGGMQNATKTGPGADVNTLSGTIVNGGNATQGEGWGQTLQRELANRFFASAFCSWYVDHDAVFFW